MLNGENDPASTFSAPHPCPFVLKLVDMDCTILLLRQLTCASNRKPKVCSGHCEYIPLWNSRSRFFFPQCMALPIECNILRALVRLKCFSLQYAIKLSWLFSGLDMLEEMKISAVFIPVINNTCSRSCLSNLRGFCLQIWAKFHCNYPAHDVRFFCCFLSFFFFFLWKIVRRRTAFKNDGIVSIPIDTARTAHDRLLGIKRLKKGTCVRRSHYQPWLSCVLVTSRLLFQSHQSH